MDWATFGLGILGGMIPWALQQIWSYWRNKHKIRMLLLREIDQNFALLGEFYERIEDMADRLKYVGSKLGETLVIHRFVELNSKEWHRDMWKNNFPAITTALSEQEMERVQAFYDDLDTIDHMRQRMATPDLSLQQETADLYEALDTIGRPKQLLDGPGDIFEECREVVMMRMERTKHPMPKKRR